LLLRWFRFDKLGFSFDRRTTIAIIPGIEFDLYAKHLGA
jgi:hypothetical protein